MEFTAPGFRLWAVGYGLTQRPHSSSFLGVPFRFQNMNRKKELLRGLWVDFGVYNMGTKDTKGTSSEFSAWSRHNIRLLTQR